MNCESPKNPNEQKQNPLNFSDEELEEQRIKDWETSCRNFCG